MNKTNEDKLINIKASLEQNTSNPIMTREKCLLQQKILNQLILKYKHKAYHNKSNIKMNRKRNISFTKSTMQSVSSVSSYHISPIMNDLNCYMADIIPKHKESIKKRMTRLKLQIEMKKKKKAKEQKNAMMILNDNIKLYQGQLMQENITKKKIIDTKKWIMNESITLYQQFKNNYYKLMNNYDINQFKKENDKKEKELNYWKAKAKRSSSAHSLFLTQKANHNTKMNNAIY